MAGSLENTGKLRELIDKSQFIGEQIEQKSGFDKGVELI